MYVRGRWVGFVEPYRAVVDGRVYDAYRAADGTVARFETHEAYIFHDGTVPGLPVMQHGGSCASATHLWDGIVEYIDSRHAADTQATTTQED
jgi:hypothetical protein